MKRATHIVIRPITILMLVASVMCGGASAEEPVRFPVPVTAIYPGDVIKEEMIIDRAFAPNMPGAAAFVSERPMAVGHIARRTLLPGQLIPINALEEQKIVTRGNVVKAVVEDGDLSIVTWVVASSGSAGSLIQLRISIPA